MSGNGKQLLKSALHLHSHFSLLRGVESPDRLLAWARAAGYTAVALADVNGMYGAVPFYLAARAAGLKPILGVELLVEDRSEIQNPKSQIGHPRLTLLARTREGYRNLCRLTSLAQLEPQRFDPPGLLLDEVAAHSEGLFILCDRPDWLGPLADRLRRRGAGELLAELTPGVGPQARSRLRRLYKAAVEAKTPVVAALDSYFASSATFSRRTEGPREEEPGGSAASRAASSIDDLRFPYLLHRVVTDIRLGASGRQPRETDYQSPDRCHWPAAAMHEFFARCPQALANANRIGEQCDDEVLELGRLHFPASYVPPGQTGFSYLHRLCVAGLRRRYRPVRPAAVSRLAHELAVIEKLRFADYFLFVHEIVAFARRRGIPVDVRGSAASSLVAYVLGFTRVCPLAADLYFERFLHEGRTDCPDIDIDLCWRRRDEVIDFCYRRWGDERVAMICTHNTLRARGAFVEVGKVMGLTPNQVFALSRHIPDGIAAYLERDWRELAEARRNLPLDDPHFRRVLALAGRLEGAPRHLGIHCGGLVISPRPLTDYLPLQRAAKGIVVTQYEMHAVEAVGLVKMDLLGNRALSEVSEAIKCGARNSECGIAEQGAAPKGNSAFRVPHSELDDIDPRDPETAALVSSGDTLGVFQAESPGMRNLCRQLRVASREDLTVALSVIRPGPAASGMKAAYIARHLGQQPPDYLHPKLRELVGRTHGVMIYQEDTMRVAVGIAGFSPAEADMLRQAVSKKRSPERMARLRERFLAKAVEHTPDLSPEAGAALWEQIAQFAAYSFCRAHACVYGRIAWQTAYLKAHYPVAFCTAVFNNHMGMYPMRVHVADAIRHGVAVLAPHVNFSDADAALEANSELPGPAAADDSHSTFLNPRSAIRLGLRFVRGLSESGIERIVRRRPYRELADLRRRAHLAEPELVNLVRCGACDGLGAGRRAMLAEITLLEPVGELLAEGQVSAVEAERSKVEGRRTKGTAISLLHSSSFAPRPSSFPWADGFSEADKLQAEIDVLGMFLSRHPMELVSGDWISTDRLGEHVGRRVAVAGILDATRTTQTRDGQLMRFVTLEDSAGLVECTLFPESYRKFGHLFYHLGPFRVEGIVEDDRGAVTVAADRAEPLLDESPVALPAELYPPSRIV